MTLRLRLQVKFANLLKTTSKLGLRVDLTISGKSTLKLGLLLKLLEAESLLRY
ncbi:hypothetical protein PZA11_007405 [Diplocarpon coronariae]